MRTFTTRFALLCTALFATAAPAMADDVRVIGEGIKLDTTSVDLYSEVQVIDTDIAAGSCDALLAISWLQIEAVTVGEVDGLPVVRTICTRATVVCEDGQSTVKYERASEEECGC